jgi:hypothetical protein
MRRWRVKTRLLCAVAIAGFVANATLAQTVPPPVAPITLPYGLPAQASPAARPFSSALDRDYWLPVRLDPYPKTSRGRPTRIVPIVTLREEITDNAGLGSGSKTLDLVSTLEASFDLSSQTRRSRVSANGIFSLQKFLSTSDFDSAGIGFSGIGQLELLKRLLFLDASAAISDTLIIPLLTPATSRGTGANRSRITTYEAGPYLTTKVADLLDIYLRARRAVVQFKGLDGATLPPGVVDATFNQLSGAITTGDHVRKYQMIVSGEYIKQRQGFLLYNGVYSLIYGEPNHLQILGRVGYESIFDPGITDLQGEIWSAGFISRPKRTSYVRVEYGHRYEKPTWDGTATIALSPKLLVAGRYLRTLESEQARIRRLLTGITAQPGDPSIGTPSIPEPLLLSLVSGTFLADDASVGISWLFDPVPTSSARPGAGTFYTGSYVTLGGAVGHRRSFPASTDDRGWSISGSLGRDLNRKLSALITLGYGDRRFVLPLVAQSKDYSARFTVSYRLSQNVTATGVYTWHKTAVRGSNPTFENVLGVALRKTF